MSLKDGGGANNASRGRGERERGAKKSFSAFQVAPLAAVQVTSVARPQAEGEDEGEEEDIRTIEVELLSVDGNDVVTEDVFNADFSFWRPLVNGDRFRF